MPRARSEQVSLEDTAYYHCISRCVRRAFLCGIDDATGKSYEHRRNWVEERLLKLASVFAIDICAYAVMSNHTHIVLRVNREQAMSWNTTEVIERWHRLHKGTLLTSRFILGEELDATSQKAVRETAEVYRKRLFDISWFMRNLNEAIARKANKEDGCTGRFWEGRFKSQALLDDAALLACMAYVDLNPVRAKLAETPEDSDFTSVKKRVRSLKQGSAEKQPVELAQFVGDDCKGKSQGLLFNLDDYLLLLDVTGRVIRDDKPGAIPPEYPPILKRLSIDETAWPGLISAFGKQFKGAVGAEGSLRQFQEHHGLSRMQGIGSAKRCFKAA
ncbi:transposase [Vibrio sp. WXL103]|uniref:transposase n=1 Tax=unclassified Vibrio TaxID=2614977 RepID=UPI003EC58B2B